MMVRHFNPDSKSSLIPVEKYSINVVGSAVVSKGTVTGCGKKYSWIYSKPTMSLWYMGFKRLSRSPVRFAVIGS